MAKKKRKIKKYIIIAIIVILVGIWYYNFQKNMSKMVNDYADSSIVEKIAELGSIKTKIKGNGTIKPNARYEVYPEVSGEVKEQYLEVGEIAGKDEELFKIGQMKIKSPIAGTLITSNIEEGDYYQVTATTKEPVAVIANMDKVKFDMEVDELDINKIQEGMSVAVSSDAVKDRTFEGIVSKIAAEGVSKNGVTTYNVTVEIEDYGDLKLGMNVDASIVVEEKEGILILPMEAINKKEDEVYVYVKDENYVSNEKEMPIKPSSMADVPGYKKQNVQIGISNKDDAEIISGLNQGDKVYYIDDTTSLMEYMMMY